MILHRFLRKQSFFVFLLAAASVLLSCQKDPRGDLIIKVKFSDQNAKTAMDNKPEVLHTQFGDHIVSLTPAQFIVRVKTMKFFDNVAYNQSGAHVLDIATFSDPDLPADSPSRNLDFTKNETVNVTPALITGQTGDDGYFIQKQVEFIILQFSIIHFFQEVLLPPEYSQISLDQFNFEWNGNIYHCDSVKNGNILRVDYLPIIAQLFTLDQGGSLNNFYFGNTDTTQLINLEQLVNSYPGLEPAGSLQDRFVWSDKYTKWTFTRPGDGQTLVVSAEISFDTQNLIQVYAGSDNEPYTQDDIIVYAPEFWNRISVSILSTIQ